MIMVFIYVSTVSKITPEPEYAYAGSTRKDVPVYLIGIPLEDEEAAEETAGDDEDGSSAKAVT